MCVCCSTLWTCPAFARMAAQHHGIGPKTVEKLYTATARGDAKNVEKAFARFPALLEDMRFVDSLRAAPQTPAATLNAVLEHYRPRLETLYPEDWPRRQQGLEEIVQMASAYTELDLFVADLALESPEEEGDDGEGRVTLSTVHSAKGLEWNAVLIIDLVEDRFPSRHALARPEDFEEERRLMYVACTRARQSLDLYVPAALYSRAERGNQHASPSPFVRELAPGLVEEWVEALAAYCAAVRPAVRVLGAKASGEGLLAPAAALGLRPITGPNLRPPPGTTASCRRKSARPRLRQRPWSLPPRRRLRGQLLRPQARSATAATAFSGAARS